MIYAKAQIAEILDAVADVNGLRVDVSGLGLADPPAFTLRLAHKDVSLALQLAEREGVPMRIGTIALDELAQAMARGWADRDCRVAMTLQEERAGVSVKVDPARLAGALD